jgi:hypothetical protein
MSVLASAAAHAFTSFTAATPAVSRDAIQPLDP